MDIKGVFYSVVHSNVQLLYPPRCLMCGHAGRNGADLCEHCHQQLPFNQTACISCALPLPVGTSAGAVCGRCQKKQPFYDQAFSVFSYEQPVIWLIQQLKFNEKLAHARLLGELLANSDCVEKIKAEEEVCILPVPLYRKRMRQRGFNQSIELARALSKKTGWPMELNAVERARDTSAQTGLDAKARRKNIRGAFAVVEPLLQKHVVIVDDVVTTGSTANELSRVLKKAGVERITVLSLARAPLNK
ncbi:MAG: ComF family protein [Gammaproteobacteria bacterium]|nr:ComF family protein [Gammaproteobacteria bacterium]